MDRPSTLASTVAATAARTPDVAAVVDADRTLTWAGLESESLAMAGELAALGSPAPLLLLLPQSASSLALMAAASSAGLDAVAVAGFHGVERARELLVDLDCAALATPGPGGGVEVLATRAAAAREASAAGPALCILTSGSTGRPKAVHHTWTTISAAVKRDPRFAGASWLLGYPMPQFAGMQVVAQTLGNGATLVLPAEFTPVATRRALVEQRVTHLNCTPTYMRQLLMALAPEDWAVCTLRHVTLGGETADQPLLDALRAALPDVRVTHTYASTELGASISVADGRAGFPAAWIDGERLRVEDGELVVRRSARAGLGYLGGPPVARDWERTGDLVEVAGDRVHFLGRVDDVINVGGFKVNPAAVASVIREVEGVLDVSVVAQSSSVVGNLVKAVVYLAPQAEAGTVRGRILARSRERLPAPMVPRLFEFPGGPPLAASQKLRRGTAAP